jgi:hypothetical protein
MASKAHRDPDQDLLGPRVSKVIKGLQAHKGTTGEMEPKVLRGHLRLGFKAHKGTTGELAPKVSKAPKGSLTRTSSLLPGSSAWLPERVPISRSRLLWPPYQPLAEQSSSSRASTPLRLLL